MKDCREYTFYVLGARGSRPANGRDFEIFGGQTSCFVVKTGKHAVIIDAGTGLYDAEPLLKDCDVIDLVFTHVHYDHIMGMLDSSIFPKDARISFLGTFRSWLSCDTISEFFKHPFWPIQPNLGPVCEITNDGTEYNLADGFRIAVTKSNHPDEGNVITLFAGERKICFLFDLEVGTTFDSSIVKGCDFLVFDGMFDDEEYQTHIGWGHSTYQDGCRLAAIYDCKELLITHHNPKNNDKKLLAFEEKAKKIFERTRFCRAGDIFLIE